ncbi:hypothetical protein P261_01195 [Lachnospiraceae bacterium TWA4]|nr:hypothetical protein P261_01195 [Lachnospiraceae bacterium TWA4]
MNYYRLPKNIRQIGEKEDGVKIYLEDYVNSFIHKKTKGGILLGHRERIGGMDCLFIRGAIETEDPFKEVHQHYDEINKSFPELEICGCFYYDGLEQVSRLQLIKLFEEAYQSKEQVLYYLHGQDEDFYIKNKEDGIKKLAGYYIYYERNELMQNYLKLMEHKDEPIQEVTKEITSGPPKKKKQLDVAEIVVRIGSLAGIFVLAFIIFSNQISIIKPSSNDTQTLPVVATLPSESFSQSESSQSETLMETQQGSVSENESESESQTPVANQLVLPKSYIISKGESIASISLKFYGTLDMVDKICSMNDINNPDYVQVGQKIHLPQRE